MSRDHNSVDGHETVTAKQRLMVVGFCMGLLLVFYVLSIGPMAGLHAVFKLASFQSALEVIYAPLIAIVESDVPLFSQVLKWYVELFR